jgi:hypothetical protein
LGRIKISLQHPTHVFLGASISESILESFSDNPLQKRYIIQITSSYHRFVDLPKMPIVIMPRT